jgi:hypothetical protein
MPDPVDIAVALIWCKEQPQKRLLVCCAVRLVEATTRAGLDVIL